MSEEKQTYMQDLFEFTVQEQTENLNLYPPNTPEVEILSHLQREALLENPSKVALKVAFLFIIARRLLQENQKLREDLNKTEKEFEEFEESIQNQLERKNQKYE